MPKRKAGKEADATYERERYHRDKTTPEGRKRIARKLERSRELRREKYASDEEWRKAEIARVKRNKYNLYGGTCIICGERTIGRDKKHPGGDYCKNHRKELWDAKRAKQREEEIREATLHVHASRKPYVPKMTQEKLAQASRDTPSFSHLRRSADHDPDETSENQPPPRKWASP